LIFFLWPSSWNFISKLERYVLFLPPVCHFPPSSGKLCRSSKMILFPLRETPDKDVKYCSFVLCPSHPVAMATFRPRGNFKLSRSINDCFTFLFPASRFTSGRTSFLQFTPFRGSFVCLLTYQLLIYVSVIIYFKPKEGEI
jgi:hypothetical protein